MVIGNTIILVDLQLVIDGLFGSQVTECVAFIIFKHCTVRRCGTVLCFLPVGEGEVVCIGCGRESEHAVFKSAILFKNIVIEHRVVCHRLIACYCQDISQRITCQVKVLVRVIYGDVPLDILFTVTAFFNAAVFCHRSNIIAEFNFKLLTCYLDNSVTVGGVSSVHLTVELYHTCEISARILFKVIYVVIGKSKDYQTFSRYRVVSAYTVGINEIVWVNRNHRWT